MIYRETPLHNAFVIDIEEKRDERGFFARSWDAEDSRTHAIASTIIQCSISYNTLKGTLRGMHLQIAPFMEAKYVRCTQGGIYDVIIDLRKDSATYLKWFGVELTAGNRTTLYVPEGCAHGFQTLEDETEVFYQITEQYAPDTARSLRWDDPAFNITWPLPVSVISDRDRTCPDFDPLAWNEQ